MGALTVPERLRHLAEPVRRSWVLAWLLVVLALSLWAVWSAEHVESRSDATAYGHCVQQQRLVERTNRDATDALIDQWNAVQRLEPIADETTGRVHDALTQSLRAAQQNLDRRIEDIPAGEYGRALAQLRAGDQIIPPVAFVPAEDCTVLNPDR